MLPKPFYLTTTLPYVNSDPHIGHALEFIQADMMVRHAQLMGREVFFNTGTDEHGQKIYDKAVESGLSPQEYVNGFADRFRQLLGALHISESINFIRTTDAGHKQAAQEFWRRCAANGDIYKKNYQVKYCVGCELEKTDSELVDGRCPLHPKLEVQQINEENYFFRWSKYQVALLDAYDRGLIDIQDAGRMKEIRTFVAAGLNDFSISRRKEKMAWGVPVPDDDEHVMYVWFDALVNYISCLGWPEQTEKFEKFWGTVEAPQAWQVAGKDNLRQQSAMWQAMLLSAGLPMSKKIIIHGFINIDGQKMSKSLGNVINPFQLITDVEACGVPQASAVEAVRYFLLRHVPMFEDGDYTWTRFVEAYNGELANGLGNLVSRVLTLCRKYNVVVLDTDVNYATQMSDELSGLYEQPNLPEVMTKLWLQAQGIDQYIQKTEPFKVAKVDVAQAQTLLREIAERLLSLAVSLQPAMPEVSQTIIGALTDANREVPKLFPRIILEK